MPPTLAQRLVAEAVGSALLFAAVIGSGIMAERLAGGNIAVALLANTLATAGMLFALITVLGPVSGAHLNPAVTLVMTLRGELSPADAPLYVGAQLGGGVLGAVAAHLMFGLPAIGSGAQDRSGPGQWLGEGIATFALVLVILGTVRHRPGWVPATVAGVITAGYWFTSSTSFANPAITVARALTPTFSGIRPEDVTGFILAQLAGALAAAALGGILYPRPAAIPATRAT